MYKKSKDEQRLELAWREFERSGEILNNAEEVLLTSETYMREVGRLFEENKRLREVVLYLARSRQHSEIDSHYVLESLVSLAARTLSELDGEK